MTPASPRELNGNDLSPANREGSKLAALTARRIEDEIIARKWPIGEVIGSEADLMARYEVSRAVLREAVRLVEHHGAARMRRGPSGGLVVQAPDVTAAVAAVVLYLEQADTSVDDLLYARRILEPVAAGLASERISEAGIERLRGVLAAETSLTSQQRLATEHNVFHLASAELSGNPTLALFIEILAELTARYAVAQASRTKRDTATVAEAVGTAHESISNAIIAGDAATAMHRADRHLAAVQEFLTSRRRPLTSTTPVSISSSAGSGAPTQEKLAEVIARRIRHDIVAGKRPVGTVIGSESDLLETYGVSRAVLREAVRLLEHHSVATMRRGPGGGLVVLERDPMASLEAVALYLEYRGSTAEELRTVRDSLELGVIDLVADQVSDPAIRQRIVDALLVDESTDYRTIGPPAHHLHTALADISGNQVLALLLRISINLWSRHTENTERAFPMPPTEIAPTVTKVHRAIVEAVLAGDKELARHRMRRHLTALADWWE